MADPPVRAAPVGVPITVQPAPGLDLTRVGPDQIVTVDGKPGLFTPLSGADPVGTTSNLEQIVDTLRAQVAQLQSDNAALNLKITQLQGPARSSDDVAAGVQHALDGLQDRLSSMTNAVSDFAVREFSLQSKVHVDVTALGTIGFYFVQPGEDVNPDVLSTLSLTIVPVPKPAPDPAAPPVAAPSEAGVDADVDEIDGLTPDQLAVLRRNHVATARAFRATATRATAAASLISMLGTDREALGRFTMLAGLLEVPGVDRVRAARLYAAGITDVATLAASSAAEVAKAYAAAARRAKDLETPSAAQIQEWIGAARRLTGVV